MIHTIFNAIDVSPDAVLAGTLGGGMASALVALFIAFFLFMLILLAATYVYLSFAFMHLARKARVSPAGIAWIPVVGPAILLSKSAKMRWWPILLLIGAWIPLIGFLFSITFTVFFIIWLWKTYEVVRKPGWWAILWIVPIVGLVLLGIAAWSKK